MTVDIDEVDIEDVQERVIEWIHALAEARFPKVIGRLGDIKEGMCCLGVANHMFSLGQKPEHDYLKRKIDLGLKVSAMKCLGAMNDGSNFHEEHTHHEIAAELVTHPDVYFIPEVADAVKSYFWLKETE